MNSKDFCKFVYLVISLGYGRAHSFYASRIPNGNIVPSQGGGFCLGVGHETCVGGGKTNAFGTDFERAGDSWTKELCEKDSDGDGFSNGEELGDPCCVWKEGIRPSREKSISHPGDANSWSNPYPKVSCNITESSVLNDPEEYPFFGADEEPRWSDLDLKYKVPANETEYMNFYFNFGANNTVLSEPQYLVGWEVSVDQERHIHHFVGYACPAVYDNIEPFSDLEEGGRERRENGLHCRRLFMAWAPGSSRMAYPLNAGLPIGPSTPHQSLVLQVHYDNPERLRGLVDHSSVRIFYTPTVRPDSVAILSLGDQILAGVDTIPASEKSWHVTHACLIKTSGVQDVRVISHIPHMHYHGKRIWTELIASGWMAGPDGRPEFERTAAAAGAPLAVFGRNDAFDADLQRAYPANATGQGYFALRDGDLLATTCVYDTSGSARPVRGGFGSADEMCIHFMLFHPAGALGREACYGGGAVIAGPWPPGRSSVAEAPALLEALLEPSPGLRLG
eukprot:CAMPEP_0177618004 /NCGR_PEP_ID=MMETSP0419_2-20121207/25284_1 /TAXON_ID=582737 /ORGANISM="Tetraselmis sp., Strain GSL018" /LENGTH=505 /DNA_ID=CAMNT_0019116753 /DNA_START=97 /DNA_END=1614 /DNA_ORIENTATION=+